MGLVADYLNNKYGESQKVYEKFTLLQYIEKKTQKAIKPKSRINIANLYAIYVLVEDYIKVGANNYEKYIGAEFSGLFERQRQLSFGDKLQNHALNSRCNEEFKKFFHGSELPIIRNQVTKKYKINIHLINTGKYDISEDVINVIDTYASILTDNFTNIIPRLDTLDIKSKIIEFFKENISNDSDSRMFEITSFVIPKNHYASQNILIGKSKESLKKEPLVLYKTGRTNANDGGTDYVMKPIGTFVQVTETLDFKKFFLDIEKINRCPITFVIKTEDTKTMVKQNIC